MAARTYKRDSNGRFASGSGGGSTGKPAAKKTAASKPAAKKPAAKKPAAGKPAAKKPAAGKPAASKPASNGRRAGQQQRALQRAIANYNRNLRVTASLAAGKRTDVGLATSLRAIDAYRGKLRPGPKVGFTSRSKPSSGSKLKSATKPKTTTSNPTAAKKPAASKPATNGRRGPRGGKVGTKAQQAKAKREQQARSKQFASKKQATSAQKAWKAASRGARMSEKGAAKKVVEAAARKAGPAPAPTRASGRTKQQSARWQRERSRQLVEFGRSAPASRFSDGHSGTSMKRVSVKVPQGNLFTGRFDMHVIRTRTTFGGSRIGRSAASKKTEKRRARAEARYETLLQERKAITSKGRARKAELARNSQRAATVARAFPVYDMGTGRRPPRQRTGRRVRNSGGQN